MKVGGREKHIHAHPFTNTHTQAGNPRAEIPPALRDFVGPVNRLRQTEKKERKKKQSRERERERDIRGVVHGKERERESESGEKRWV